MIGEPFAVFRRRGEGGNAKQDPSLRLPLAGLLGMTSLVAMQRTAGLLGITSLAGRAGKLATGGMTNRGALCGLLAVLIWRHLDRVETVLCVDEAGEMPNPRRGRKGSFGRRLQEGVEFGDYGEGGADGSDGFAKLLNLVGFHVAKHGGGAGQIVYFIGAKAHDAAGGGVRGNGIVAEDEDTCRLGISLNWAISFHAEDAVDDDEIGAGGGVDIENRAIDTGPMENIFWPAIATAGHDAEKIFHRKSDASPVMSFELGHGNEKVDAENGLGQVELLEKRSAGFEFDALDIVDVEIAEVAAEFPGEFGEADGFENGLGVAVECGAIANEHARSAEFEKTFAGGSDDGRMGVHGADRIVADEIGFEKYGFVF